MYCSCPAALAWDGVYELVCSSHMLPVICPPGLEKAVLQWLCMVGTCTCSYSSLSLVELLISEIIVAHGEKSFLNRFQKLKLIVAGLR
jgi:hypothetical protein